MEGVGGAAIPCRTDPECQPHRLPSALPGNRDAGPGGDRPTCPWNRRQPTTRGPRHPAPGMRGTEAFCGGVPHRARRGHRVARKSTKVPSHATQDRGPPKLRAEHVPPVCRARRAAARPCSPEGHPPHLPARDGSEARRPGRAAELPKPRHASFGAAAHAKHSLDLVQRLHARYARHGLGDRELTDVWGLLRRPAPVLRARRGLPHFNATRPTSTCCSGRGCSCRRWRFAVWRIRVPSFVTRYASFMA